MNQAIEEYGVDAVKEVLDLFLISKKAPTREWCLKFLNKHGLATSRLQHVSVNFRLDAYLWNREKSAYERGYVLRIADRKNDTRFELSVVYEELNQLLEDVNNETN